MKRASIVSIGNELLIGQTSDTNAAYLSTKLLSVGISVISTYVIGDDASSIVRALKLAGSDADFVLITGGLGPTDDDLTRRALAEFLDAKLQLESLLLDRIEQHFVRRGLQMPSKNKVQAYIPAGAKALVNNLGTAPGIMADFDGKLIAAMPGVPAEMKRMFEESVLPQLKKLVSEQAIVVKKLKCFGAGESNITELIGDIMQRGRNPLINCTVNSGVITLYIIAAAKNEDTARKMADKDEARLTELLGELVYGNDEQTLAEVVGEKLAQQRKTICVAESCTGGLLVKLLTDVPGASRYFTHGWVTYSNDAKTGELGVPAETIEKYGAVSGQVAKAMAVCARKKAGTDCAIGITGIAGPTGATEQKPLGLVYISIDSDNDCQTQRFIFPHDRGLIRLRTAQTALNMLRLRL